MELLDFFTYFEWGPLKEILSTFYENLQFKRDQFGWKYKIDLSFYKGKLSLSIGKRFLFILENCLSI